MNRALKLHHKTKLLTSFKDHFINMVEDSTFSFHLFVFINKEE